MSTWARGLVCLALLVGASGVEAGAAPPPCQALAVSPSFARDRTAFCYWFRPGSRPELRFWMSRDGFRTWHQRSATGIALGNGTAVSQLLVSPLYAEDHAVYLQTSMGLYQTTDEGTTFTQASPLVTSFGIDNLSMYVDAGKLAGTDPRATVLYADPGDRTSFQIQTPIHVPVVGSPDRDVRFVLPPAFPASGTSYVLANRSEEGQTRGRLYACSAAFSCTEVLAAFPPGHSVRDAFFAPDFAASRRMYVLTEDATPARLGARLWRSVDGGRTFSQDPLTANLGRQVRALGASGIGISIAFTSPSKILLRWSFGATTPASRRSSALPANLLYSSSDAGAHWRLVGSARAPEQAGARGTLPWPDGSLIYGSSAVNRMWLAGSYVVTLGADSRRGYGGPFCSRDAGRTWRRTC